MSNHTRIDSEHRLPKRVASWLRRSFTAASPNQRLASMMGTSVLILSGCLIITGYWDVLPTLFPGLPWLGELVAWVIAGALGFMTEMVMTKLLDRFRPSGKL